MMTSRSQDKDRIDLIARIIAAGDPVHIVENYEAENPRVPQHNGAWWRLDSWRSPAPDGYRKAPCAACGSPVAKPAYVTESVMCEYCDPLDEN